MLCINSLCTIIVAPGPAIISVATMPALCAAPAAPLAATNRMAAPMASSSSRALAGARVCVPQRQQQRRAASMRVAAVASPVKQAAGKPGKAASISPEEAAMLYSDMYLGREFEDMCAQMYYRGKMFGFVHLYSGQEAVSTGVIKACLRKDDFISSTYRDHVHALSKGVSARKVMAELFGKKTGVSRGQGGSMHMFDREHGLLGGYAFIGEGIPIGLGAAFQVAYSQRVLGNESDDRVSVNFFGDGTCNVGQFYESLNMATLYKLPCIFVVENNKWAIGMNHPRATAPSSVGDNEPWIYKKGPAFGMPGVHVDGMDVMKVREVAMEAVQRARRGEGPTLIEAETYRFRGHSLADPDELRRKEEKDHYAARDPIPQFAKFMVANGLATESDIKALEAKVKEEVEDCVDYAENSPKPDMSQLLENVFADPKGFGIGPDGRYRYENPGFTAGTAEVS